MTLKSKIQNLENSHYSYFVGTGTQRPLANESTRMIKYTSCRDINHREEKTSAANAVRIDSIKPKLSKNKKDASFIRCQKCKAINTLMVIIFWILKARGIFAIVLIALNTERIM
jgi:hypothetical protein